MEHEEDIASYVAAYVDATEIHSQGLCLIVNSPFSIKLIVDLYYGFANGWVGFVLHAPLSLHIRHVLIFVVLYQNWTCFGTGRLSAILIKNLK